MERGSRLVGLARLRYTQPLETLAAATRRRRRAAGGGARAAAGIFFEPLLGPAAQGVATGRDGIPSLLPPAVGSAAAGISSPRRASALRAQARTRGGSCSKRSRAAEVHNLSEKRRRSKINEKMKALKSLIPYSNKQNRPLNSQNVADARQKFNLKKTAVQKALDALADSGQISFKEYGKQKIYIARQDQFDIPIGEELEEMKKTNARLQKNLQIKIKQLVRLNLHTVMMGRAMGSGECVLILRIGCVLHFQSRGI